MVDTLLLKERETSAQMICVCCNCQRERLAENEWRERTPRPGEHLTHGICTDCLYELYPDLAPLIRKR